MNKIKKQSVVKVSFSTTITTLCMVRVTGIEPALPFENMNLNHTRLPVPPYPHIKFSSSEFYTARTSEAEHFA